MADTTTVDGEDARDVAICGFSLKFPQNVHSADDFWDLMVEKRCATSTFPSNRFNAEGFYDKKNRLSSIPLQGGHFISEDPACFDADFFGISPAEAASMDPMQRWLLETAYHAIENAGMSVESLRGSSTAVFTGSFNLDHMLHLGRDIEDSPVYASVGTGLSMLANRLSWFFDLRGPSIGLDSACSSTAMAIDMACQSLMTGSCDMALVAGCNMASAPETYVWMSNLNFLSPDGRCYSFDHRANGYARGEGVGVLVLTRVRDAVAAGHTIRAVIRATGANEDGKTPGITQPSRVAQQRLIRETYRKARLSMAPTRFFEAHGTGTAIGDPREALAIGHAFRHVRTTDDPLYIGAVKSNIGHLEGASGLAAVFKAVLALEKGLIPPNTNFEALNPKIDAEFLKLKFPQAVVPWPTSGLRRASVNSFGYGGANSHIVLDDAYNYLRLRSLPGKHRTVENPLPTYIPPTITHHPPATTANGNHAPVDHHDGTSSRFLQEPPPPVPRLLVWSTADKAGRDRVVAAYQENHASHTTTAESESDRPQRGATDNIEKDASSSSSSFLADLAYTLDSHRSLLPWRSFALLRSRAELKDLGARLSRPVRASDKEVRLGFVFTGQGAQWFAMGRELLVYDSFRAELESAGGYLQSLGCPWNVKDELSQSEQTTNIHDAEYSQPLCTILQVALVNLLRRFHIQPAAVVGHSSGEIAAAYAGGYLSRESAWKLAYFRGLCSAKLISSSPPFQEQGAMMAIGVSEKQATALLAPFQQDAASFGISLACINGPDNVTVAGEAPLIDRLHTYLKNERKNIFARKLQVPLAYHSRQMEATSAEYVSLVGCLTGPESEFGDDEATAETETKTVPMISSVTGQRVDAARLQDAQYWASNMTSPVQFHQALQTMCAQSDAALVKKIDRSHRTASVVHHLLEVGPHAALESPIRATLRALPRDRARSVGYSALLRRRQSAIETTLQTVGELFSIGVSVNLRAVNEPTGVAGADEHEQEQEQEAPSRSLLVDVPGYPFDHTQRYWHEGRLSRNYRLRPSAPSELLGVRSRDWNPADARWGHFLRKAEMPWVEQHGIQGKTLYPAAGMLVMVIEAAKQLVATAKGGRSIESYTLQHVSIEAPMDLTHNPNLEVQTSLRQISERHDALEDGEAAWEFTVRSIVAADEWLVNCRGSISVQYTNAEPSWQDEVSQSQQKAMSASVAKSLSRCNSEVDPQHMYDFLRRHGYEYGPIFQAAQRQHCVDPTGKGLQQASAEVILYHSTEEPHVVHPVSLDAIFHIFLTALTAGGARPTAVNVPYKIGCLWVSNTGLSALGTKRVDAYTAITQTTRRGFTCDGGALDSQSTAPGGGSSPALKLWYRDFELRTVAKAAAAPAFRLPNPEQFCMNVETKAALAMLGPEETASLLDDMHPPAHDTTGFFQDLSLLVELSLRRLERAIGPGDLLAKHPGLPLWADRYWHWAQHHLATGRASKAAPPLCCNGMAKAASSEGEEAQFQQVCDRLQDRNHVGRLYVQVATHLAALVTGDVNVLELLMPSGLLRNYYEELATYRGAQQAASYLDLLAHQQPGLRILEIGGGTASATRTLIRTLRASEARPTDGVAGPAGEETGFLRCERYDFTDVSSSFLEGARHEFAAHAAQMSFRTLDVERDFEEQGFGRETYDVVVADNVLHVSSDLVQTLQNVRRVLKPGGKILIHELFRPDGWTAGFVFGLFPGWWLGTRDQITRSLSPNISAKMWHSVLQESGFTGTDLVFRDFVDDTAHHVGWIIATAGASHAVGSNVKPPVLKLSGPKRNVVLVVDEVSVDQQSLAKHLSASLENMHGMQPRIVSVDTASNAILSDRTEDYAYQESLIILLTDYGPSWLGAVRETDWDFLQRLVQTSRRLLWVTAGGGRDVPEPEHAMLDGLARTLRSEDYGLHCVTVALDRSNPASSEGDKVKHLTRVVSEMAARTVGQSYEQEYIEVDGRLHVRRLVDAEYVKRAVNTRLTAYETVPVRLGGGESDVAFEVATTDSESTDLDGGTPFYAACPAPSQADHETETRTGTGLVEIEVKAVSLSSRDRDCAVGLVANPKYGSYCAGIVTRAPTKPLPNGTANTEQEEEGEIIRPGDRVFAILEGSFRSHVQVPQTAVVRLPTEVPLAYACRAMPPMVTAYLALIEAGHVDRHDAVLVHDGASALGEVALRLLDRRGVSALWTTVSNRDEYEWVRQNLHLPPDRILPSRWFHGQTSPVLLAPFTQKFNLVFQPDQDKVTPSLLSCLDWVVPGGRYIVLGTENPTSHAIVASQKRMLSTQSDSGVSLIFVPPSYHHNNSSSAFREPLRTAAALAQTTVHKSTMPKVTQFNATELEKCFNHLRRMEQRDTIVVSMQEEPSTIQVRAPRKPSYMLDAHATYVVAGGLGGLGRGITRWLADRGARHLILLSRSGPRTPEAQQLLDDLRPRGIVVETPRCDITDKVNLQTVLDDCLSRLPAVKGCIQAAMVMSEAIFPNLPFSKWKQTIDSKVAASWNLHCALPQHGLDFFLMTSSIMGILGSVSLAAYNAGNTFQDALARHRTARGQRAAALNLGAVPDAGYLTEHASERDRRLLLLPDAHDDKYAVHPVAEVCALLDVFCDPATPLAASPASCQVVIGIRPPSRWKQQAATAPATMNQPFWGHMHHIPALTQQQQQQQQQQQFMGTAAAAVVVDLAQRVAGAPSLADAAERAAEALAQRVSTQLNTPLDRLDAHRPMYSYGLDSLTAVDLRNWVARVFGADVPTFDILGGATFASTGLDIARKVRLAK